MQSDPRVTESMCLWQNLRWEWGASEIAGCFYTLGLEFPRGMRNPQVGPHNRCLVPLHWLNTLLGSRGRGWELSSWGKWTNGSKVADEGWRVQCAGLKCTEPRAWLLSLFILCTLHLRSGWLEYWVFPGFGSVFDGKPRFLGNFHSKALLSMLRK